MTQTISSNTGCHQYHGHCINVYNHNALCESRKGVNIYIDFAPSSCVTKLDILSSLSFLLAGSTCPVLTVSLTSPTPSLCAGSRQPVSPTCLPPPPQFTGGSRAVQSHTAQYGNMFPVIYWSTIEWNGMRRTEPSQ